MLDPYKYCAVCSQPFSVCQCERDADWNLANAEAEESFDNGAGRNEPEDHEREEDEIEAALNECDQRDDGGCNLAGSEYCECECPYRDLDTEPANTSNKFSQTSRHASKR